MCSNNRLHFFSLFGIVYLFYHEFWLITGLLVYPGCILFGSMFIIPLILAVVPTWITTIKMAETCLMLVMNHAEIIVTVTSVAAHLYMTVALGAGKLYVNTAFAALVKFACTCVALTQIHVIGVVHG